MFERRGSFGKGSNGTGVLPRGLPRILRLHYGVHVQDWRPEGWCVEARTAKACSYQKPTRSRAGAPDARAKAL